MGLILVEQTQTSIEHTKFSLLYVVEHNQTMLVEHNHTMPVEHTSVTQNKALTDPALSAHGTPGTALTASSTSGSSTIGKGTKLTALEVKH